LPQSFIPAQSNDPRPKTLFTISKVSDTGHKLTLDAILMSDSGSCAGLTIPARKAIEMGLKPITSKFGILTFQGAGDDTFDKIMMKPQVELEVTFVQEDGSEIKKGCLTNAWCHRVEYEKAHEESPEPDQARESSLTQLDGSPEASHGHRADESPVSPNGRKTVTSLEKISPIQHRSSDHPLDRATIGMTILHQMGLHINCRVAELEIEEEDITYED
jgi:hypothetical protein